MSIAIVLAGYLFLTFQTAETREAIALPILANPVALGGIAMVLTLEHFVAIVAVESRITETFAMGAHSISIATHVAPKNVAAIKPGETGIAEAFAIAADSMSIAVVGARDCDGAVHISIAKVAKAFAFMANSVSGASIGTSKPMAAI